MDSRKLTFLSLEGVFKEARLRQEAAFVGSICGATAEAVDEEGHYQKIQCQVHPEQIAILTEAIQQDPKHEAIYAGKLGELYYDSDDPGHAEPCLEQAIFLPMVDNPHLQFLQKRTTLYNKLAIIRLTQNRGSDALSLLQSGREEEKAPTKEFQNAGTDALLAYAYLMTGTPEKSLQTIATAMDLHAQLLFPESRIIAHELGLLLKANARYFDKDRAISAYHVSRTPFKKHAMDCADINLTEIYGSADPRMILKHDLPLSFPALKTLYHGSYHEHED